MCINLDETSVGCFHGNVNGKLAVPYKKLPDCVLPLTQAAPREHIRMGLAHVGIVCDSRVAQQLLPQVFIVLSKYLALRSSRHACLVAIQYVFTTEEFEVDIHRNYGLGYLSSSCLPTPLLGQSYFGIAHGCLGTTFPSQCFSRSRSVRH